VEGLTDTGIELTDCELEGDKLLFPPLFAKYITVTATIIAAAVKGNVFLISIPNEAAKAIHDGQLKTLG
jgi:hypothetical protein